MSNKGKLTIVVIGANGTIGQEVVKRIHEQGHQVIEVSRTSGDFQADIQDKKSLEELFPKIGHFNAVANASGSVAFKGIGELTDEELAFSIGNKLVGQINLVRAALPYIADGGSFTLISGVLSEEPILGGVVASLVNSGVEGFVKAVAYELPRAIRINCISPTVLAESKGYHDSFPGFIPVEGWKVARAYEKSIFGIVTGKVIKVY